MALEKKHKKWLTLKNTRRQLICCNPESKPVINDIGEVVVNNGVVEVQKRTLVGQQVVLLTQRSVSKR